MSIDSENRITAFIIAVVSEFAKAHSLSCQQAFRYLDRYHGIDFTEKHYEIEHTLSFETVVDDLTQYCHRMGGELV